MKINRNLYTTKRYSSANKTNQKRGKTKQLNQESVQKNSGWHTKLMKEKL